MSRGRFRRYAVGDRIGEHLSVLGVVSDTRGRHPVYIVWDHRSWCPAALKVFRNTRDARREAEVLQSMAHPNIARSLGVYEPAMLLLEFLEGETLDAAMSARPEGRLTTPDAIRSAVYIGAALEHAHGRGWLHLDVKPANVILTGGRPVLFDFGTARRLDGPKRSAPVGTDAYIAPEECAGEPVSPASDVFGLGVTLHELLTGEMPFPKPSRARPYPQLTESPRPLREQRPGVSVHLERLILSCLAREPEARPPLAALMPELHAQLRSGPRIWPRELEPHLKAPPSRRGRRTEQSGGHESCSTTRVQVRAERLAGDHP